MLTAYDAIKQLKIEFFGGDVLFDLIITASPLISSSNSFICKIENDDLGMIYVLVSPQGCYILPNSIYERFKTDLRGEYSFEIKGSVSDGIT